MTIKTKTKKLPDIRTREEAEALAGKITADIVQQRHLLLQYDEKKKLIDHRFLEPAESLEKDIKANKKRIHKYANKDRRNWGKAKSLKLAHGTLKFELNGPTVKPAKGWTFAKVIEALLKVRSLRKYLRPKFDLNKELVKADHRAKKLTDEKLSQMGLQIDSTSETFTFDPHLTETPAKQKENA